MQKEIDEIVTVAQALAAATEPQAVLVLLEELALLVSAALQEHHNQNQNQN